MGKILTHGSLFAGIGGQDLGFERAGWRTVWQVENEPFCRAVLGTRFPEADRSVSDVREAGSRNLARVECITAGVPCQDVSVAGKRAGLQGERTGLFFEFARILQELRPAWFVFENVPGLLSSNRGRDFAEVLRVLMVECRYGVCWRVLDSQFFGVAQRRRRVFIVGCLGEPCPAEVLFEPESGARHPAAGNETAKGITGRIGKGVDSDCTTTLVAYPLRTNERNNSNPRCSNYVIQDVRGGTRDKTDHGQGIGIREGGPSYTLGAVERHAVAFSENQRGEIVTSERAHQLTSGGGKPGQGYPAVAVSRDAVPKTAGGLITDLRAGNPHPSAVTCAPPDPDGVRDFAGLPKGLDSARYRALGNAWTTQVAEWIARRIIGIGRHGIDHD